MRGANYYTEKKIMHKNILYSIGDKKANAFITLEREIKLCIST